ncbi:PEPxxWA-CTERM sorting domain-containing protein [Sphingomonas aliaeris]|uniref:PEPxxWA-CTERM sorting domain-containing protein n=1 Tax=Sphingomonas aliaeris TaxID=2759526 RepID=UPI001CED1E5A|nr:PEPxxWA-CTERM sorting domain-containing protein [Sphingomonas aliaeris]
MDDFYTLFMQRPLNNLLNETDNFAPSPTTLGQNDYAINGEGFPVGTQDNSDGFYTLTLTFGDGAVITGDYVGSTFTAGSSTTVGNTTYAMTGFGWDRSPANNVGRYSLVTAGSDENDYTGQFSFSQQVAAVPESATWGMMILGFGMIGGAARRRRHVARLSYS